MNDALASMVLAFVPVLGRALLHFFWQGALIGLVATLLLHALRGAKPQARYAVACGALLACALAPVLTIAWLLIDTPTLVASPTVAPVAVAKDAFAVAMYVVPQAWNLDDAMPLIVSIWACGACALLLRMTLGVWWIQRLCRAPQDAVSATWQARLDALASRFGLRRRIALRLVGAIASPASVGWWRPVVLLPSALLARMPIELVEALLAHELAHIRRHDYLVNLLQSAVEALLFHHPVVWWLSHRIRVEREQIADQLAAEAIGEPRRLALALSELSESLSPASPLRLPAPALAAHGGHLMSRIEQLVRPALHRSHAGRIAFPLLGLAVAGVALIAHAQAGSATPVVAATPATAATTAQLAVAAPAANPVVVERTEQVARADSDDVDTGRTSYAIVRKGSQSITMSGDTRDIDGIKAIRDSMGGDFLWLRRDGKAWVITDPAVMDRVERAWSAMEPLEREMDGLNSQMDVYNKKMDALNAQMDSLSSLQGEHPELDAASERMEALGRQQEALARKQEALAGQMANAGEARQDELSREMDALSAQQEALSRQMEAESRTMEAASARMQRNAQPMEALGKQMEEAGKPMEALGKQMEGIGAQMDAVSKQAERETLRLIDEAMAQGLASPAPVRR